MAVEDSNYVLEQDKNLLKIDKGSVERGHLRFLLKNDPRMLELRQKAKVEVITEPL